MTVLLGGLLAVLTMMGGCRGVTPIFRGGEGALQLQSLGEEPIALSGRFVTQVYRNADGVETSFILSDQPLSRILAGEVTEGQFVHISLLWLPRAGRTPLTTTATNASIRYVIMTGDEVGIYGGAGFVMPRGTVGDSSLTITVRDASLKLIERSDGFRDLLTPARLDGTLTARRDNQQARKAHFAVSQLVTNRLGRSIIVRDDEPWLIDRGPLVMAGARAHETPPPAH